MTKTKQLANYLANCATGWLLSNDWIHSEDVPDEPTGNNLFVGLRDLIYAELQTIPGLDDRIAKAKEL